MVSSGNVPSLWKMAKKSSKWPKMRIFQIFQYFVVIEVRIPLRPSALDSVLIFPLRTNFNSAMCCYPFPSCCFCLRILSSRGPCCCRCRSAAAGSSQCWAWLQASHCSKDCWCQVAHATSFLLKALDTPGAQELLNSMGKSILSLVWVLVLCLFRLLFVTIPLRTIIKKIAMAEAMTLEVVMMVCDRIL